MYYGDTNAVVRLSPRVDLKNLSVDTAALPSTKGFVFTILTQLVEGEVRSRVFAPLAGIAEDHVVSFSGRRAERKGDKNGKEKGEKRRC